MARGTLERLRHRIEVYSKEEARTEFNEITYEYTKTMTVWAEIMPTNKTSAEKSIPGESIQENITHKITLRNGSIKNPRNDMFFKYKGQSFEVIYYMPNYKRNDLIEFYCKLIIEGENDYGEN